MNHETKRTLLAAAGIAVVLGTLYSLAFRMSAPPRSQSAAGAADAKTATQTAAVELAKVRATAASVAQSVSPGEQAAGELQLDDPEQIAIADARKPIEAQSPEIQQRYYQGWLTGLRQAQALQRDSLQRMEQERKAASDSQTRSLLEQQIARQRKLIEERSEQIASFESKVAPTGP